MLNPRLCILLFCWSAMVRGFQPLPLLATSRRLQLQYTSIESIFTTTLWSTPPRKPRRALQKRRKKGGTDSSSSPSDFRRTTKLEDDFPWDTAESRPLIKSDRVEAGEDYWIAEEDLKKVQEERKPPIRQPGQVTDEKLWGEVLSPYRQNWIGVASVVVVVLAVIVSQFPELLQTPVITIPDL